MCWSGGGAGQGPRLALDLSHSSFEEGPPFISRRSSKSDPDVRRVPVQSSVFETGDEGRAGRRLGPSRALGRSAPDSKVQVREANPHSRSQLHSPRRPQHRLPPACHSYDQQSQLFARLSGLPLLLRPAWPGRCPQLLLPQPRSTLHSQRLSHPTLSLLHLQQPHHSLLPSHPPPPLPPLPPILPPIPPSSTPSLA